MDELNCWGGRHATADDRRAIAATIVEDVFTAIRPRLMELVITFLSRPVAAIAMFELELALLAIVREIGRLVLQAVVQALEPSDRNQLPHAIFYECDGYRRRSDQTANRKISTRFGQITLWRTGYRSWRRGEETIFPLELMLGLAANVSPALLDLIGKTTARAGMSQQATLDAIREQSGVSMGVKRLRQCVAALAARLEPLRQTHQVDALLNLLKTASASRGNRKPALCVGRDGITLRHRSGCFEVATAATISVFDRAGKRLGTIYLAHSPEPGQATMDALLTELLEELFLRWTGPLPRLAYVTDSGSHEIDYFQRVLRRMKRPTTGEKLAWTRIADFYHAGERVWRMAAALFTPKEERQSQAWARRMLKNLKRASGVSRVLHSAASLASRRQLGKSRQSDFKKAYRYLQQRTRYMRYHDYQSNRLPIGSGVTEAACKTIFTQRLKLSGMRWSYEGAAHILTLRTILLSGVWQSTYGASLNAGAPQLRPYAPTAEIKSSLAA